MATILEKKCYKILGICKEMDISYRTQKKHKNHNRKTVQKLVMSKWKTKTRI